jgi:hypothetical protein
MKNNDVPSKNPEIRITEIISQIDNFVLRTVLRFPFPWDAKPIKCEDRDCKFGLFKGPKLIIICTASDNLEEAKAFEVRIQNRYDQLVFEE